MTVETTFTDMAIAAVKIVSHIESPGVRQIINVVPERIVAQQSLAVDTVTGATFCGKAVIAAVSDAAVQAGGDIAALTKALPRTRTRAQSYEADVIVIGAGGSGLAAAVSAHQAGASVIVIEKLGFAGGSTIFSDGAFNAADPEGEASITMSSGNRTTVQELTAKPPKDNFEAELQKTVTRQFADFTSSGRAGLFDSPEWHMLQTYNGGDYEGIPELIKVLAANALANTKWMAELGTVWRPNLGSATGSLWQRSHYGNPDFPNGLHSIIPYMNYIRTHDNIEVQFDTRASELISSGGRVSGVKALRDGAAMTYTARRGVVMATGGFGANVAMRQKYNILWDDLGDSIGTSNHRLAAQGDGIVMGEKVGAKLEDMGLIQLHPSGEPGTGLMNLHPGTAGLNRIFVNTSGNRFVAEDARRDDMIKAIYKQPGSVMWVVADRARYEPTDPLISVQVEIGKAIKADTLDELAQKMEVPAASLKASIDQYNAGFDGVTDPYGLRTYGKKMGTGPFYAARRLPTVHHTMGGLLIDSSARVIGANDRPIPGFYAAGEVTGGVHGANRLGGNALADCSVFGKIAGASAALKSDE
jgi:flavocytochrome c